MLAAKRKGSAQLWLKIANLLKSQDRHDLASLYFGKVLKKNPTNIQEAQKAGWVYKVDAKGNKAYVSPDNKQFIEVK